MKTAILAYLKKPQTIIAVVVALMAQMIFCAVWMTAYDGVLDRVDRLHIAIVNEDGEFGSNLEKQLQHDLPFEVAPLTAEQATDGLLKRDVHLILTIPEAFDQALATPGAQAKLGFTLNESNPQLTKSVMQSAIAQITEQVNRNAAMQGTEVVLQQLRMSAEQASQTAQGLVGKVTSDLKALNPVDGMHNQMVPMMLVLASYVGAMMMAMNIHQVSESIGSALSKKQHFAFRSFIIVVAAALISIAGSSFIAALGGQMDSGFGLFWLFHFLTLLTFMFFAQMFLVVFGMAGMFLNMAMLSMQLVTSGTIVPLQMLNGFYQWLGHFLPATYSVEGIMNLQFGGNHTDRDVLLLLVTLLCSLAITAAVTAIKKQPASEKTTIPAPAPNLAELSAS